MTFPDSSTSPQHWVVIPAAGVGARMGAEIPKQYLALLDRTVLAHTILRLSSHPRIAGVVVVVAANDPHWARVSATLPDSKPIITSIGGAERCHSVLSGLHALSDVAAPGDWVLVHDAARPCLRHEDIDRLMDELADHPVGGLLGVPVSETVKRADASGTVIATVDRDGLWRAQTPQMFHWQRLLKALQSAMASGRLVTDEAAAMEAAGHPPRMVEGQGDNIKITRPQDLTLAELYLKQQEQA